MKNAWWEVVADCLVEFFGYSQKKADAAAARRRTDIENPPPGLESDLIYHDEPFNVASALAGASREMRPPRDRYDAIYALRFGAAERHVAAERQRMALVHELIVSDPAVMMGKPVVAGTRITVELILEKLAAGATVDELLNSHPRLTREGVQAALGFAADAIRTWVVYLGPRKVT